VAVTLKGTVALAVAIASISLGAPARAATRIELTNGLSGDGELSIPIDDFGVYGVIPIMGGDRFTAVASTPQLATSLAALVLVVKTPDNKQSTVALSDAMSWHMLLETGQSDGIVGTHTNVVRQIVNDLTVTNGVGTSSFSVAAQNQFSLSFGVTQRIVVGTPSGHSTLEQKYDITNNGTTSVDLVIHAIWEADMYFDNPSPDDDVAGAVPGLCAVYIRDPGGNYRSTTLQHGPLSTLPLSYYFAGNAGDRPMNMDPPIRTAVDSQEQWIFDNPTGGMPTNWRNYVSGVGVSTAGELVSATDGDATMGLEYRFTLAPGASETIHLRRQYGSTTVTCPSVPSTCGNGQLDSNLGEPCDGADTTTCNGATCMLNVCGDGHINTLAEETCEELADNAMCDAMTCKAPVCGDGYHNLQAEECDPGEETPDCNADCTLRRCGDGYINVMADEECENDALCDPTTCQVTYTLGGGCAGCASQSSSSVWLAGLAFAFIARRRRRARTA
jgi:hypothetical protein